MSKVSNGDKLLWGAYTQYTPTGKSLFVKAGKYGKIPHIGDIVYFYSNSLKRVAHVGIVYNILYGNNQYTIQTIEGNTSSQPGFSRNGGMVATKWYHIKSLDEVGGSNRINGFGTPMYDYDTCDAETFISVCNREVGYVEKASNNFLESKTANAGDKNFTKYGEWYGNNGAYWCQQFISYCAYVASKEFLSKKVFRWRKENDNWYYYKYGKKIKSNWAYIDNRWYVFDNSGKMITGWFKQNNEWYYLNPDDGAMLSGQWVFYKNNYYYLTKTGLMATNVYVKFNSYYCYVDENGVWNKILLNDYDKKQELVE